MEKIVRRISVFKAPEQVTDLIEEIKVLQKKLDAMELPALKQQLADRNQEINDIYHKIEYTRPDAVAMVKTYKRLEIALRERRLLKNQLSVIQMVRDTNIKSLQPTAILATATKAYEKVEAIAG